MSNPRFADVLPIVLLFIAVTCNAFAVAAAIPDVSGVYNQTTCSCVGVQCSAMLPQLNNMYIAQNGSDLVVTSPGPFSMMGSVGASGDFLVQLGDGYLYCIGRKRDNSMSLNCSFGLDSSYRCDVEYVQVFPPAAYIAGNYSVVYEPGVANFNTCNWMLPSPLLKITQTNGTAGVTIEGIAEPVTGAVNATGYMSVLGDYLKCTAQFGGSSTLLTCLSFNAPDGPKCLSTIYQNHYPIVNGNYTTSSCTCAGLIDTCSFPSSVFIVQSGNRLSMNAGGAPFSGEVAMNTSIVLTSGPTRCVGNVDNGTVSLRCGIVGTFICTMTLESAPTTPPVPPQPPIPVINGNYSVDCSCMPGTCGSLLGPVMLITQETASTVVATTASYTYTGSVNSTGHVTLSSAQGNCTGLYSSSGFGLQCSSATSSCQASLTTAPIVATQSYVGAIYQLTSCSCTLGVCGLMFTHHNLTITGPSNALVAEMNGSSNFTGLVSQVNSILLSNDMLTCTGVFNMSGTEGIVMTCALKTASAVTCSSSFARRADLPGPPAPATRIAGNYILATCTCRGDVSCSSMFDSEVISISQPWDYGVVVGGNRHSLVGWITFDNSMVLSDSRGVWRCDGFFYAATNYTRFACNSTAGTNAASCTATYAPLAAPPPAVPVMTGSYTARDCNCGDGSQCSAISFTQTGSVVNAASSVYGAMTGTVDSSGHVDISTGTARCTGTFSSSEASAQLVCVDNIRTCFITYVADPVSGFSVNVAGGSLLTVRAYEPLYLYASVQEASGSVEWSWQLTAPAASVTLDPVSSRTSTLYIAPYTLQPGQSYKFTVTATSAGTTVERQVSVTVLHTPPVAIIKGGNNRSANRMRPLILDASGSSNPDAPRDSLVYVWKCMVGVVTCPFTVPSAPIVTLDMSTQIAQRTYTFTVTVYNGVSSSSASVAVGLVTSAFPLLLLDIPPVVDPTAVMVVAVNSTGSSGLWTWSAPPSCINLAQSGVLLSPANQQTIIINRNSFVPGATSCFLTATVVTPQGVQTSVQATFDVARVPAGGTCTVSPSSGVALSTVFSISCNGWSGATQQLMYEFSALASSTNASMLISPAQPSASIRSQLFPTSSVTVRISDLNGITTTVTVPVTVTSSPNAESNAADVVQTGLDSVQQQLAAGNLAAASFNIAAFAQLLNGYPSQSSHAGLTQRTRMISLLNATVHSGMSSSEVQQTISTLSAIVQDKQQTDVPLRSSALNILQNLLTQIRTQVVPSSTLQLALETIDSSVTPTSESSSVASQAVHLVDTVAQLQMAQLTCEAPAVSLSSANIAVTSHKVGASLLQGVFSVGDASFLLPSSVPSVIGPQHDGCAGIQRVTWGDAFPASSSIGLSSDVFALSVTNTSGSELPVRHMSQNITFTIPFSRRMSANAIISCVWWNGKQFVPDGCSAATFTATEVICACNHLTAFAAMETVPSSVPVAAIVVPVILGVAIIVAVFIVYWRYRSRRERSRTRSDDVFAVDNERGPDPLSKRTFSQQSLSGMPLMVLPNTPVGSPRPVPLIPLSVDALDDGIKRHGSTAGLLSTTRQEGSLEAPDDDSRKPSEVSVQMYPTEEIELQPTPRPRSDSPVSQQHETSPTSPSQQQPRRRWVEQAVEYVEDVDDVVPDTQGDNH